MCKPPRAQQLNAPILRLVRDKGALGDKDLHAFLAREFGAPVGAAAIDPVDQMLFSASVNLAKRRLVRYALLRLDAQRRATITAQGELFLARGFTRLDARVRRSLDEAWRGLSLAAHEAPIGEPASDGPEAEGQEGGRVREILEASGLVHHGLGCGSALVPVWSRLRSWIVDVREANGWLCLRTHVMALPDKHAARGALVEAAMRANARLTGVEVLHRRKNSHAVPRGRMSNRSYRWRGYRRRHLAAPFDRRC